MRRREAVRPLTCVLRSRHSHIHVQHGSRLAVSSEPEMVPLLSAFHSRWKMWAFEGRIESRLYDLGSSLNQPLTANR
jgi:hypothetical protein